MLKNRSIESPYGFLYDNSYRLCSQANYEKSVKRAVKFSDKISFLPIFDNMYSDLPHYPRSEAAFKGSNVIPPWFIKDHAASIKKINSYLLRYDGFGCEDEYLKSIMPERLKRDLVPSGVDRYMYFISPIIPKSKILPDVLRTSMQLKRAYYIKKMEKKTALTRTIGTQSMYRESSMQTDPYSPGFLLRPGAEPEILSLIPLSYGNGLPVGLHEIEVIERARIRREIENRPVDMKDLDQVRKRRAELNKFEVDEWKIRENQIDELQMARLEVIMKLMAERRGNLEQMRHEMMTRIYKDKLEVKQEKLKIVRYEYIKAIRKLLKSRKKVKIDREDKSIILQYSNPMSQAWAPLTRMGQFPDRRSERYVVNNQYLTTFNGLEDLDDSLPSFVKNPNIKIPKLNMFTKDGFKKKRYRFEDELKELYKYLKSKDQALFLKKTKHLKFLEKLDNIVERPPTPTMDFSDIMDYDVDLAIMLLQQMVKGRAIQVMMYEGKEKRIELIKELRSTHAIQTEEIKVKKQERKITLALQRNRLLNEHKEAILNDYLGDLKGQSLGDIYDFLNKELIRLQEERRIHAFIMLAERERRLREAEESGLRQTEERRRREEDDIFKQIVKVHQTTVKSYLEDIVKDNVDWQAEEEARREVEILATEINETAYELEKRRDYLLTEEIVSDLVHHFLIPEVYKTENRERIALNQRRFLLAAHRVILKTTDVVVSDDAEALENLLSNMSLEASEENKENENIENEQKEDNAENVRVDVGVETTENNEPRDNDDAPEDKDDPPNDNPDAPQDDSGVSKEPDNEEA